jgi:hypothetical protein
VHAGTDQLANGPKPVRNRGSSPGRRDSRTLADQRSVRARRTLKLGAAMLSAWATLGGGGDELFDLPASGGDARLVILTSMMSGAAARAASNGAGRQTVASTICVRG